MTLVASKDLPDIIMFFDPAVAVDPLCAGLLGFEGECPPGIVPEPGGCFMAVFTGV